MPGRAGCDMADTSGIHELIARTRRRLRLQAALEGATTSLIAAAPLALVAVYLVRLGAVRPATGGALLAASALLVAAAALGAALRPVSAVAAATLLDRSANLAGRLSSAYQFERALAEGAPSPETRDFMRAAMDDAVRATPEADAVAAAPYRRPRDSRPALAFTLASALVASLGVDRGDAPAAPTATPTVAGAPPAEERTIPPLDVDDLDYSRDLIADLRKSASATGDLALARFADEVEALLNAAAAGSIDREALLEGVAAAEETYRSGSPEAVAETLADLEKAGAELTKSSLARDLGRALAGGELERASAALEALAADLERGDRSPREREALAGALESAAKELDAAADKRGFARAESIARAQKKVREAEDALAQAKDDPRERERRERRLEREERELKKLEREAKRRDDSESRRELKELRRDMRKAAESLRRPGESPRSRREISKTMRDMARRTAKIDGDRRKMANRPKVASQISDLKEAMRRAQQKGGDGPDDRFGRNRRNRDFASRARGGSGDKGAWKPGQKGGGSKENAGEGEAQPGRELGGGHDPDLLGDKTAKSGKTKDESLAGTHGRGPSTRETILTAAQKGFASRGYRDVYTRYKSVVEEVIEAEKVPSGYKYYVKKYFQRIKPHEP